MRRALHAAIIAAALAVTGCLEQVDFEWQADGRIPEPRGFPPSSATPTAPPTPVPEAIDFGDGRSGSLVATTTRTLNTCSAVTLGTNGTITRPVGAPVVAVGTRVVVWQVSDVFAISGDPTVVQEATGLDAGRFTITRVVTASPLVVDPPLPRRYASNALKRAQMCTVPEYTSLFVDAAGELRPAPWNGTTGGLLMALVDGPCVINGGVDAGATGFTGGLPGGQDICTTNSTALDLGFDFAGFKGSGLHASDPDAAGRGNLANAGGGGNACDAGGGGGGNGGAGGFGGRAGIGSVDDTRGMPGAVVALSPLSRLVLGGGGGGGNQDQNAGTTGGAGGGVVLLACRSMSGTGRIESNGGSALLAGGALDYDGAGGGGAGGTIILLTSSGSMISDRIRAEGGSGGAATDSATVRAGPGGGGGGGTILLRNMTAPEVSVEGGPHGVGTTAMDAWGATVGTLGKITTE